MTPKQKARELIEQFQKNVTVEWFHDCPTGKIHAILTKQCALIAVKELQAATWNVSTYINSFKLICVADHTTIEYWERVEKEIKLIDL